MSYFVHYFTIWKRRLTRIVCRPAVRSFLKRHRINSVRTLFSNKRVLAILALIVSISLVGLVYFLFQLRNKFMVEFKFKVGWWKTASMSIAVLESLEQVNFPKEIPEDDDGRLYSYLEHDHGSSIIWKVDGYAKYEKKLADIKHLAPFGQFPTWTGLNQTGFWVFSYGPNRKGNLTGGGDGDPDKEELSPTASAIRAFKITEHLANMRGISPEYLEVAVAIRAYVDGEAALVIRYEDSLTKRFHLDTIPRTGFKKDGFCYKILDLPFDKRVNLAHFFAVVSDIHKADEYEFKKEWVGHHRSSCYRGLSEEPDAEFTSYFGAPELVLAHARRKDIVL